MWRDAKGEPGGYRGSKYWDAMVRYTDKMTGKVVAKLDDLGLREETLVIWTADNGTYQGITSPFQGRHSRGGKGSTKDSGTHVAFIASWPGTIPEGQVSESLVDLTDVLPTLIEVAGAPVPDNVQLDGVSLVPLFHGKARRKDHIYCWYDRNGVREKASQHVRTARYKLYSDGRFFDTLTDPDEEHDLGAAPIPHRLAPVHKSLKQAIERHLEITCAADAAQNAERARHGAP